MLLTKLKALPRLRILHLNPLLHARVRRSKSKYALPLLLCLTRFPMQGAPNLIADLRALWCKPTLRSFGPISTEVLFADDGGFPSWEDLTPSPLSEPERALPLSTPAQRVSATRELSVLVAQPSAPAFRLPYQQFFGFTDDEASASGVCAVGWTADHSAPTVMPSDCIFSALLKTLHAQHPALQSLHLDIIDHQTIPLEPFCACLSPLIASEVQRLTIYVRGAVFVADELQISSEPAHSCGEGNDRTDRETEQLPHGSGTRRARTCDAQEAAAKIQAKVLRNHGQCRVHYQRHIGYSWSEHHSAVEACTAWSPYQHLLTSNCYHTSTSPVV